jgi:selenocysteine lyase/cysteine desulfurase
MGMVEHLERMRNRFGKQPAADAAQRLLETVRESVIGRDCAVEGPYGPCRLTYADYTASGRSLEFIERFIVDEVLPLYANTHTESSVTGLRTTRFREDARRIILESCAGDADDVVIFCGSGATGAINKLIDILNIRIPADLDARHGLSDHVPIEARPVVFIGPYEHHSNELPWRESLADVVTIPEDANGQIDQARLRAELDRFAARPLKIGSFSAASNVTGIVSDTWGISRLLHEHGALAFWDFAAAAPYIRIEMNPPAGGDRRACKDAVFISPHKFIGGPGTPGVLIVKRALLTNRVPSVPGGGTVSYVNTVEHDYLRDHAHREEGGTPAIIEAIRAGLVFGLKRAVGEDLIEEREEGYVRRAIESWSRDPNIEVLGNHEARRLSIVSFVIRRGDRVLHHNFVVALLNDLFGIQARGGCSCAGPYGHRLLGIDLAESLRFHEAVNHGNEGIKPGWVRVNFNYFISEQTFTFILEAVHFIAAEGWKFLRHYSFDHLTGLWRHRLQRADAGLSLLDLNYREGRLHYVSKRHCEPERACRGYLERARRILADVETEAPPPPGTPLPDDAEALRWFPLPHETGI